MIGSCTCQECENCIEHNLDEGWIKCKEIEAATNHKKESE
jgi:hypothetical protein